MDNARRVDFSITFADSQKLQLLQKKLLRAEELLESYESLASGFTAQFRDLECFSEFPSCYKLLLQLETYREEVSCHKRTLKKMLQYSHGTADLVSGLESLFLLNIN